MKLGIQIVLWLASIFFAYKIYDSISGPIKFKQIKNERYAKVINRLKDIRKAQIAHKDVNGVFSNNFDSLIEFIDEGIFTLIEKRDSSYLEYDRTYRIDMLREVIVIDTLGTVSVKDSLFGDSNSYKKMAYIPIEGVQDSMFKINAEVINKNGYKENIINRINPDWHPNIIGTHTFNYNKDYIVIDGKKQVNNDE